MTSAIHRYLTAAGLDSSSPMRALALTLATCFETAPETGECPDPSAVRANRLVSRFADALEESDLRFERSPFRTGHYVIPETVDCGTGQFDYDQGIQVANYVDFSTGQDYRCTGESGKQDSCGPPACRPEPDQRVEDTGNGEFGECSTMRGLIETYRPGPGLDETDIDSVCLVNPDKTVFGEITAAIKWTAGLIENGSGLAVGRYQRGLHGHRRTWSLPASLPCD